MIVSSRVDGKIKILVVGGKSVTVELIHMQAYSRNKEMFAIAKTLKDF